MNEYQYLTIVCDNCDTPYEIRWDGEHPSAPLTCPFCGHEIVDMKKSQGGPLVHFGFGPDLRQRKREIPSLAFASELTLT